ncbi:hypothetical protein [Aeromonas salmonicida]|uniref:hypothetical protein n=1 Tax=Aeromonas salmonicida TaxID=645 RepID=UPI003D193E73
MSEISEVYLTLIIIVSFISVLCIFCIVKYREVTEGGLLGLSAWFFFASPVTFYLASNGLDASELAQQIYFQGVWAERYRDLNFEHETINSILSKSMSLSGSIDKEKMYTYIWHKFFHGFFKIFVPLIWAAMGTWSMVKFLDFRIKVIPNNSSQQDASKTGTSA